MANRGREALEGIHPHETGSAPTCILATRRSYRRKKSFSMTGHFTTIRKCDHDKAVTVGGVNAFAVYVALCRIHSDSRPELKDSFPAGAARVARHCGLSTKTVKRMLPLLKKEGLVSILSGRRNDRYTDHEENRITLLGRDCQTLGRDSQSVLEVPRRKKESKDSKKDSANETESDFASFWESYPRKVSKPFALKAWRKAKLPPLSDILSALEKYKAVWKDPQFIPHPASWLNARRWEDEVTTATTTPSKAIPEPRLDIVQHKEPPRRVTT